MKVLLTGHKGYIGSVGGAMLREAGHDVVGLDTGLFEGCDFGDPAKPLPEVRKDIRDLVLADLKGFEAVIHLAALSNDPLGNLNGNLTYDINHRASVKIAELAKEAGVKRYVFASSCSTYGAAGDDFLDEAASLNPVTAYGESKVFVERDVQKLADDNFSPTFMRNATAYGVSPRLRLDVVLNDFVAAAVTTGRIFIKSDGTPWRPIVHIRDIMGAAIATLSAPKEKIHNEVFNVGSKAENYRISELAQIVNDVTGAKIEYDPNGGPDKRCYRVTCAKIELVLGWKPKWTARKGAEELYEAYRKYNLNDEQRSRYMRITTIQRRLKAGELDSSLHWMSRTVGV